MITIPEPKRTTLSETAQESLADIDPDDDFEKFYILVVTMDRNYGGPQEGGWWYDTRDIECMTRAFGSERLLEVLEKFGVEYPASRRGRGSVLGGTDYEFHVCTDISEFPPRQYGSSIYE